MQMNRVKPIFFSLSILLISSALAIAGCSSNATRHKAAPEDYGLTQHVSPDGDWRCHLTGDVAVAPEEARKATEKELSLIAGDTQISLWAATDYHTTTLIVRFTGPGIESLKSELQGSSAAHADLLTKIAATTMHANIHRRPIYSEESLRVYAQEDKPTPTKGFYAECELIEHAYDNDSISTSFGSIGTFSDNAFYCVITEGSHTAKDRVINDSFEVISNSGFIAPQAPSEQTMIPDDAIPWQEASQHIGENATVYGPVVDAEYAATSNGRPTFIDLGSAYPETNRVTVVVWDEDRSAFPEAPESMYSGCTICVTGSIYYYNNACNIKVTSPSQIRVL